MVNDWFVGYMDKTLYVGLEVGRDVIDVVGVDGGVEKVEREGEGWV